MSHRRMLTLCLALLCVLPLAAKDKKKKVLLTDDVLQAKSVYVFVDPSAGVDAADPLANRTARLDVENAIRKWGRFELAADPYNADLVIMVRKGSGKMARATISGIPVNNEPVMMQSPMPGGTPDNRPVNQSPTSDPWNPQRMDGPTPQIEAGNPDDMFAVFRGHRYSPTEAPAVWRYLAKNALQGPDVPAVEEFRKIIAKAEKQREDKP
jgi:hypothetical protein